MKPIFTRFIKSLFLSFFVYCSGYLFAQTPATLPYTTGFESGVLSSEWIATSSLSTGEIKPFTAITTACVPHTGNYFLGMHHTSAGSGAYNLNEAELFLDLSSTVGQVDLEFWFAEWNDEQETQDGIWLSDDGGNNYVKMLDLYGPNFTDLQWYHFKINLDSAANALNLNFNSNFVIKFQQYDNYYFNGGNDGHMYDDINIYENCAAQSSFTASADTICVGDSVSFTNTSTGTTAYMWYEDNSPVGIQAVYGRKYNNPGTYEIKLGVTNGICTDTSSLELLVSAYPTLNLGLDTTTCPGNPITLDAGTGRDSVRWNTNATGQTIVANTAQPYSVTVWENGCPGGDTININLFPAPPPVDIGNDTTICWDDSILLDATTSGATYMWHDNSTNPTQYASEAGFYWVKTTDANTCTSSDSLNISIHKRPSVSLSVAPSNNVCYGDVFSFRANGNSAGSIMYQWKINGVNSGAPTTSFSFQPTDLGYPDTITVDLLTDLCAGSGFDAYASNSIVMFINPAPKAISGIQGVDTVLENTSKTYVVPVTSNNSYVWRVEGGTIPGDSTSNTVAVNWGTADPNGMITMLETDDNNCTRPNELPVVIISVVGIDEENYIGVGNAYPNPANQTVNIPVFAKRTGRIQLDLFDITGKLVQGIYSGPIASDRYFTFDVGSLNEGLYFYRIQTEEGYTTTKKLTIKH